MEIMVTFAAQYVTLKTDKIMKIGQKMLLMLSALLMAFPAFAKEVVKVQGEFTYYAEGSESVNEAKAKALEGAKLKAMEKEFGMSVSSNTMSQETYSGGEENSYFSMLSFTEVNGEWLETTGEPEYTIEYIQGVLCVRCKVAGRAREISNEAADFVAKVLKNGVEEKFADVNFRAGDDMFLLFRAPLDGYVAVYLVDETPEAFCLLPYLSDTGGQHKVEKNKEYVFFSQAKACEGSGIVDEYNLTCCNAVERNQIYVLFSPNPFVKAVDMQMNENLPRQLSFEEFKKWLGKSRIRDPKMGLKQIPITIRQ